MREKNYNTGLRGVLFEDRHYARMGSAIWLYGWLVLRQTHQSGQLGWVLGGAPISYREIEEETGFMRKTLERWMGRLRRGGVHRDGRDTAGRGYSNHEGKKICTDAPQKCGGCPQCCGGGTSFSRQGWQSKPVVSTIWRRDR